MMKKKSREAFIPQEREDTIRHKIISILKGQPLSAKEISQDIGISEKEVYEHLEHIKQTVSKSGHILGITPSECNKCGFVFKKRERFKKPGKCPDCVSESISVPLFLIVQ
jgi:transcriptional regulator